MGPLKIAVLFLKCTWCIFWVLTSFGIGFWRFCVTEVSHNLYIWSYNHFLPFSHKLTANLTTWEDGLFYCKSLKHVAIVAKRVEWSRTNLFTSLSFKFSFYLITFHTNIKQIGYISDVLFWIYAYEFTRTCKRKLTQIYSCYLWID